MPRLIFCHFDDQPLPENMTIVSRLQRPARTECSSRKDSIKNNSWGPSVRIDDNLRRLIHYFYADMDSVDNQHLNSITPIKLRNAVESSGRTVLKMGNPEVTNIVMVARR
jgi:hypothetical protein